MKIIHWKVNPRGSIAWCALLLTGLIVLPGCRPGNRKETSSNPAGAYQLVSVDGKTVPTSVSHDGHQLEVRSGEFRINEDGTCASTTVFVPEGGPEVKREVSATYTRDGSKLTMRWQGAGVTAGEVQGNTFRMNNEGTVFLYQK